MHDPCHLNSVALDGDGNLLVSARARQRDLQDRPRTPATSIWRLGGKESSFELEPGARVRPPARRPPPRRRRDHAVRQRLGGSAGERPALARARAEARPAGEDRVGGPVVGAPATRCSPATQGSTQSLTDGGAFVGWGGAAAVVLRVQRRRPAVFDARFAPDGVESYRAYRGAVGRRRARASRRVVRARARRPCRRAGTARPTSPAGAARRTAASAVTAPRTGFETAIELPAIRPNRHRRGARRRGPGARDGGRRPQADGEVREVRPEREVEAPARAGRQRSTSGSSVECSAASRSGHSGDSARARAGGREPLERRADRAPRHAEPRAGGDCSQASGLTAGLRRSRRGCTSRSRTPRNSSVRRYSPAGSTAAALVAGARAPARRVEEPVQPRELARRGCARSTMSAM